MTLKKSGEALTKKLAFQGLQIRLMEAETFFLVSNLEALDNHLQVTALVAATIRTKSKSLLRSCLLHHFTVQTIMELKRLNKSRSL